MKRLFRLFAPVALVSVLVQGAWSQALAPFMRMQKPTATQEVLQTKARKYTPANGKGPAIWLIGVAHIGEAAYYKDLQKLLDAQDSVFYEGVTKNGVDPAAPKDPESDKRQASTYKLLSDTLGLQFQLFGIDYKRPTFHNSDLSWEEMQALEAKLPKDPSGKPTLSTIGSMLDANSQQGKMLGTMLQTIKSDPSSVEAFRLILIETVSNPNAITMGLSPQLNELLIKNRNAKVLGDLKTEISKPKPAKSVAIFFGAGHMGDMEAHLTTDLGYKPGEERWFTAAKGDTAKVTSSQGKMMLDMVRKQFAGAGKGG